MKFKNLLSNLFSTKSASSARVLESPWSLFTHYGDPRWSKYSFDTLANRGYSQNAIVYRCCDLRASFIDSLNWHVYKGDKLVEDMYHPLVKLLKRPNTRPDSNSFFYSLMVSVDLAGNAYVHMVTPSEREQAPRELLLLRPDHVDLDYYTSGQGGVPRAYRYTPGYYDGQPRGQRLFPIDPVTGYSDILHWMNHNPRDAFCGQATLSAAYRNMETFNEGVDHVKKLLENKGVMPGIYTTDQNISDEEQQQIRMMVESFQPGGERYGQSQILHAGLEYKSTSASPQEMELIQNEIEQARFIAQAMGVPEQLVGIPDSQTYANYQEARLAFYESTMVPVAVNLEQKLTDSLAPRFGDDLWICFDRNSIPAVEERRSRTLESIKDITFMTINEKRKLVGLPEFPEGGDELDQPKKAPAF